MNIKLLRGLSLILLMSLLTPMTVRGQMASQDLMVSGSVSRDDLTVGFDPGTLKLSNHQPNIVAEVGLRRDGMHSFIVILEAPAVPSYQGGVSGFAATSSWKTVQNKLDLNAASVRAYVEYLESQQALMIDAFQNTLDRNLMIQHQYVYALNGIVVELTLEEALKILPLAGVKDVQLDAAHHLTTDVSPEWVGATRLWDGSATGGVGTQGEGIIIGILDSGINMDHPSFAAVGDDGYSHANPFGTGNYLGWCNPSNPNHNPSYVCNAKLIGAWDYADASWSGLGSEDDGPFDNHSHGSHVASIAAGNYVDQATLYAPTVRFADSISGIAPHANLIAYDVCGATGSCYLSDVVAAIDQAIQDGVDIINESIALGGDPFTGAKQIAYLNAISAGIFYVRSAGNEGPGAGSVGPEPPWTFSTAALTHNRKMLNSLTDMVGGANPPVGAFEGQGFTSEYGPAEIVYSANFTETLKSGATAENARLCAMGNPDDTLFESPWEDGTFNGEIVVCDQGGYPRIEKSYNLRQSGAGGFVLADDGNGVVLDSHYLPGLHISVQDGNALKNWLDPSVVQTATITGYSMNYNFTNGDIMAGFSSRGPAEIDLIKPDGGTPGVSIWAAWSDRPGGPDAGNEYGYKDGTSMASPQVAGLAALIKSTHPNWTPSEIKSALMTTATTANTYKETIPPTSTDPFDVGSGRIQVDQAVQAGLIFDETVANYSGANEENVKDLNIPSFANSSCYLACSWVRTVKNPLSVPVTWTAILNSPSGAEMIIDPVSFDLPAGDSIQFTLAISMTEDTSMEEWLFGSLVFSPDISGVPDAYLPLAVYFAKSTNPDVILKDVNLDLVDGYGVIDYTLRLANPGTTAVNYNLLDSVPANSQYLNGSAWGGLSYSAGTNQLSFQGSFVAPDIRLAPESVWIGYLPLKDFGVDPYQLPDNPDEGGWLIGGLDFYYLGERYSQAIWSINGTIEAGATSGLSTSFINMPMPFADSINNLLAPWWADINFEDGGNLYLAQLEDNLGNEYVVFEWENAPEFGTNGLVTASFQVWMISGTDHVWFAYGTMDPAWWAGGTVGIENESGLAGDQFYISSPHLSIPPTGTRPDGSFDLWVDFVGTPPIEMGFSVRATGPSFSRIMNEVIVQSSLGKTEKAWATSWVNEWFGSWLPLLANGGAPP